MKRIISIILLLIVSLTLLSQKTQSPIYWIPEKYVDSLVTNGTETKYKNYLKPIESIVNENSKWYIDTYNGMRQPLIKTNNSNAKDYLVKELSLNFNVFKKKEQDSINNIKYSFKVYTDSLILKGYTNDRLIESKKYIREFKGYKFEELRKTNRHLLLQGRYDIYNFKGEKIESDVTLSSTGEIIGSKMLIAYNIKRVIIPDESKNVYDLVEFHLNDKTTKKLAITYNEKEKVWFAYDYQVKKDKYTIYVLPKFVFRLNKI